MPLKVATMEKKPGTLVISPAGSIDSDNYTILEERVNSVLKTPPKILIFDMKDVDYITSMGVGTVLKAKKVIGSTGGEFLMVNLQPQIQKVFDIIKALPSQKIFATIEELDVYLTSIQKKQKE